MSAPDAASAPKVKGANCLNIRDTVRREVGEPTWQAFVDGLPVPQKLLATRRVLTVEWVDLHAWMGVEHAIYRDLLGGDPQRFRHIARTSTASVFNSVYKFFLKVGAPGFVVAQTTRIWNSYFTVGNLHLIERVDPPTQARPTRIALHEFPAYEWFPYGVQGTMEQILSMCRANQPRVEIVKNAVSAGCHDCEFHLFY